MKLKIIISILLILVLFIVLVFCKEHFINYISYNDDPRDFYVKFVDFIHGVYRKPDMIVYDRYGNQHLLDYRSEPRFHYGNHPHHFNGHVWMNPSDRVVIPV